jgi:hypothetical protein
MSSFSQQVSDLLPPVIVFVGYATGQVCATIVEQLVHLFVVLVEIEFTFVVFGTRTPVVDKSIIRSSKSAKFVCFAFAIL